MKNRLMTAIFDMMSGTDVDRYQALISDPKVVIEKRSLNYHYTPGFDGDDGEEELNLKVRYSLYGYDMDMLNLFKKVRFMTVLGIESGTYRKYIEFTENEDYDIINEIEASVADRMFHVIEYIDKTEEPYRAFQNNRESPYFFDNKLKFDKEAQQFILLPEDN